MAGNMSPVLRAVDMSIYDRLGPRTRAVIAESPLDLVVGQMLGDCPISCMDPNTAEFLDEPLARWLEKMIARKMSAPPEKFRLAPRPRRRF